MQSCLLFDKSKEFNKYKISVCESQVINYRNLYKMLKVVYIYVCKEPLHLLTQNNTKKKPARWNLHNFYYPVISSVDINIKLR